MKLLIVFALFFCGLTAHPTSESRKPPTFNDDYTVSGLLILPYAEIREPFTAYFDITNNRSRVDYYGDLVLTVQRADSLTEHAYGVNYKIAYMVDNDGNPQRVCFQTEGTNTSFVEPQSVLPDLSPFSYSGSTRCPSDDYFRKSNENCEVWKYVVVNGAKKNEYTFWLRRDDDDEAIPVQYLMKGYDSLLGSHYDEYRLVYNDYKEGPHNPSLFEVTNNYTCRSFPGPGVEHIASHNPIKEFVHHIYDHIEKEFETFIAKHGKNYVNNTHHEFRKNIFKHNFRYIHSMNRKLIDFKLKINMFMDLTDEELAARRGRFVTKGYNGGQPFPHNHTLKVPDNWDWRLLGAVTPVKDQAVCGSCWSFGTTGTIEGTYFVKTGQLVSLSEQQLIDCSWNQQNNGCDGGEDFRSYEYIMKAGGLATDDDYGDYLGQDGKCHDKTVRKTVKLNGFVNVTSGNPSALRVAIFKNGPVTVAIDASHKSLSFYGNGIYFEPKCGNKPGDLDHQVLAVGYGTLFGKDYWLIKNSWSTHWGNDGYVLMNQKNNNCGVMTMPTYPLIA